MAKLLTTKGIGFFLDELFKSSKEYVYIVTPYLKIDKQLEERIIEALDNGLKIIFIYGKDRNQKNQIQFSNRIELYFYENLHAKFYMNESKLLITSMNMHSFSEANNREIGVSFSKENNDNSDIEIINDCLKEFDSIKKQSEKLNQFENQSLQQNLKSNDSLNNFKDKNYLINSNQIANKENGKTSYLKFDQQIYKQLLKEYRKNLLYDSHSQLSDNEIDNFVIALNDGISQIEKIISSDKKYNAMKTELLDRIARINQFEIVRILEIKKRDGDFKGSKVLVENQSTKKSDWYTSKEILTINGKLVAVKLNDGFFNKYIELET